MSTFDQNWEKIHKEREIAKYPNTDVVVYVARNYFDRDRANLKILDLGCGGGANTCFLAREGFDAYALDGSESAIARTELYLKELGLSAKTSVGDFAELPFSDNFFDLIIDSQALCTNTLPSLNIILRECNRVLKNSGSLYSTYLLSAGTTGFGTGKMIEENTYTDITTGKLRGVGTIHFFNRREIHDIFSSAGFEVLSIDSCTKTERDERVVVSYYMADFKKIRKN